MTKLSWMLSTVLFAPGIGFGGVADLSSIPSVRSVLSQTVLSQNNPSPPDESPGGSRFAEVPPWNETFNDTFFSNEPPNTNDGGSRGPSVCVIAPLDQTTGVEVWSDRPTFIWQGELARVELYAQNREAPIWSQNLSQNDSYFQYTGEVLKPGQKYDLMLYDTVSDPFGLPTFRVTFKVMDENKRDEVEQALKQLENQLKPQEKSTEAIAHARFQYWAERQLWSDALIEAFSVKDPSPDLKELLQKTIPDKFCN